MLLVLILLALLDHPRWSVRAGAERCLTPANALTLPLLEWREKRGPAEGQRRARWLVNAYYANNAGRLVSRLGQLPYIESFDRAVGQYWLGVADEVLAALVAMDANVDRVVLASLPWYAWYELRSRLATHLMLSDRVRARR